MNRAKREQVKRFLATEWGVRVEQISDDEALSYRRKRWGLVHSVAATALLVYILLYIFSNPQYADLWLFILVLVVAFLAVLRVMIRKTLSPAPLQITKELLAEQLEVAPQEITDEQAVSYDRGEWKALLLQMSIAGLVYIGIRLLFPSLLVNVLFLAVVLYIGVLSVLRLWPVKRG